MNTTKIIRPCGHPTCSARANQYQLMKGQPEGIVMTAKLQNGWTIVGGVFFCPAHSFDGDFDK